MIQIQSDKTLSQKAIARIQERGVTLEDIAELVYDLQKPYLKELSMEHCLDNVKKVLEKREVCNAVLTGIELDILTEEGKLSSPLSEIIASDEGLYGIDEVLALSILSNILNINRIN